MRTLSLLSAALILLALGCQPNGRTSARPHVCPQCGVVHADAGDAFRPEPSANGYTLSLHGPSTDYAQDPLALQVLEFRVTPPEGQDVALGRVHVSCTACVSVISGAGQRTSGGEPAKVIVRQFKDKPTPAAGVLLTVMVQDGKGTSLSMMVPLQ